MSTAALVTAMTSAGIATIVGSVVGGLFTRKKISAEAAQVITNAGAGVAASVEGFVERISAENKRLYEENAALHVEVRTLRIENSTLQDKVDELTRKVDLLTDQLARVSADTQATRATVERVERQQHEERE